MFLIALGHNKYIYPNPVSGLAPGTLLIYFTPIALFTHSINQQLHTHLHNIHPCVWHKSTPASPPFYDKRNPLLMDNVSWNPQVRPTCDWLGNSAYDPRSEKQSFIDYYWRFSKTLPSYKDCYLIDPLYFSPTFSDRTRRRRTSADGVDRIVMFSHDPQLAH